MDKVELGNLARWVEKEAGSEVVLGVTIGRRNHRSDYYDEPPAPFMGKLLSWEEARPFLDGDFDAYYCCSFPCYTIYAWTKTKVMFMVEYEMGCELCVVPRNPVSSFPLVYGG